MLCNGALLPIAQYSALFSLLGTTYGGNGTTNFALPDLQGRVPIYRSNTYPEGVSAGAEQVTLDAEHDADAQPPATRHDDCRPQEDAGVDVGCELIATDYDDSPPTSVVQSNPASLGMIGNNQPHPNLQPYLALNWCICHRTVSSRPATDRPRDPVRKGVRDEHTICRARSACSAGILRPASGALCNGQLIVDCAEPGAVFADRDDLRGRRHSDRSGCRT